MKLKPKENHIFSLKKTGKYFVLTGMFAIISFYTHAQENIKVKSVFKDFQAGYAKRDTSVAESFCNRLFDKDISIVGTGADEWLVGLSQAKRLIKNDWAYWMNLSIDTTTVKWHKEGI